MQLSDKNIISDMRTAYGKALVELGSKDPNIVCVGADTTDSLKTKLFGDKFPTRLYNVGIAEANLVSIAAGLAIAGKVVFASTYAAFLPGRCLDQIRNTICYPFLDVKLVVWHAGHIYNANNSKHEGNCSFRFHSCEKFNSPSKLYSRTLFHASCTSVKFQYIRR